MSKKEEVLNKLKNALIVSCQVYPEDPMYTPDMALLFARAAAQGGADGIRANSPEQIAMIKKELPHLPVIGIWKKFDPACEVYITPGIEEARAVIAAGADILALDATFHTAPNGQPAWKLIEQVKEEFPDLLVIADVATLEEAENALQAGADLAAPTLFGYTRETEGKEQPDFKLLEDMVKMAEGKGLILMEGNLRTPQQAARALEAGAYAVVVGSAITRPHYVARWFKDAIEQE